MIDFQISQRVYHKNLREYGYVLSLDTGDPTSIIVMFDNDEEREVSKELLERILII